MYKFDADTKLFLVTGYTDFRCGIDSLCKTLVDNGVEDILENKAFIFMCKHKDKIKILHWGGAGFWLITYRLSEAKFRWINNQSSLKEINKKQLEWLLDGLEIEPKNYHKEIKNKILF